MARAGTMLGLSLLKLEQYEPAMDQLMEARDHVQYDETAWRLWFALGQLHEARMETDSAIRAYRTSIDIIEGIRGNFTIEEFKSSYLEDKMEVYSSLIRLLMESGDGGGSLQVSERARSRTFLDMLGNHRILVGDEEGSELASLEQDLRQEIQSLSRLLQKEDMGMTRGSQRQALIQEIVEAQEQYEAVVTRIKLYDPDYASMVNMETVKIIDLQSQMEPGMAFLVYWVGKDKLYAWLIFRDRLISKTIALNEDRITNVVTTCRRGVSNDRNDPYLEGYRHLIKPIERELQDCSTLVIIPHLALHFLPFQSLMPDSLSHMIDRYDLLYTPSLSAYALSSGKEVDPRKQFLALALGELELGGLPPLPGTTKEVSSISTLFRDPEVSYGTSSTEAYFKSSADPFELIHLATHGVMVREQPMYSYLVLAPSDEEDGMLTVREIFGLNLNARLVVLSACETGLGSLSSGDEIIGLSRAFLYAGAKDVIVSLWSVADDPTAYLMTRFYSYLEEHNAVQALRLAQLDTRKQYSLPVYWAPFQLIGTGR
jgi:CHAT domain-containing protein